MKTPPPRILTVLGTAFLLALNWSCSQKTESEANLSVFDGHSLAGWDIQEAEKKWWRVKDGAIEGGSLEE
ncbi:MAG: hypothetical protein ACI92G_004838, partial [Candidatus Pelagisphaera sp.]